MLNKIFLWGNLQIGWTLSFWQILAILLKQLLGNLLMTENAALQSVWAGKSQAGNPIGSALVIFNIHLNYMIIAHILYFTNFPK